jgi:pimeloyl-ACP methyl ester carboxylesterase
VIEYQVGAWRLLSGSQRPFDEAGIRAMAQADFDRTPNLLTTFNHAPLSDVGEWTGRLDEIAAPALIIHGTDDPVLPFAHGQALHAALRGSTLLAMDGVGHELHRPDWPLILDAIERHTAR